MAADRSPTPPELITIPSSDRAFRAHVQGIAAGHASAPADLERRLRRIFPRVVVRDRALSGERSAWYVYRDGGWRPSRDGPWWDDPTLPRVVASADGWLTEVTPTAAGLLGIDVADIADRHITDFIVPGTLEDAQALFAVIGAGDPLNATVVLRPTSGDVIAVDLYATKSGDDVVWVFRLAGDVDVASDRGPAPTRVTVATSPATDVAFRAYTQRALARMPEPTVDGLVLRLRRLYPHAAVRVEGDRWVAERSPGGMPSAAEGWWQDPSLPRVRYDAQALILEVNPQAQAFLGHELVGHHWQTFVTPGSTEEVTSMLAILADVGAAESRFRMPRSDGSLVEFDSYTTVTGEEFVTVMRPVDTGGGTGTRD